MEQNEITDETDYVEDNPTSETTEATDDSTSKSSTAQLDGFDIVCIILIGTICLAFLAFIFKKIFGRFMIQSKWFTFKDLPDHDKKQK